MAGLTTGQFLAQFVGLPGKITAQGLGVATIHSAIMDPESETVRRNALIGILRADLFEGAGSLLEKAADQQVIKDALTEIYKGRYGQHESGAGLDRNMTLYR